MAKRFASTEIWGEDWFLEMKNEYKLLWYYMLAKCDHAGFWKPNKKVFEITTETKINLATALSLFNYEKERIKVTGKGNWWVIDFFYFQYGDTFNIKNNLHISVYKAMNQEDMCITQLRGLKRLKLRTWTGSAEDFGTLKEKDKDIFNNIVDNIIVKNSENENKKNQPINFRAQGEQLYLDRVSKSQQAKRDREENNKIKVAG